jgi:hypothetical protein
MLLIILVLSNVSGPIKREIESKISMLLRGEGTPPTVILNPQKI